MDLNQLLEKRASISADIDTIRAEWKGKEGTMPPATEEKLSKAFDDYDKNDAKIEKAEREAAYDSRKKEIADKKAEDRNEKGGLDQRGKGEGRDATAERKAFEGLLRSGQLHMDPRELTTLKAYQADDMAGGGFFVTPEEVADTILTLLEDEVFVRAHATVIPLTTADSLGVYAMDTDPSDTDWTTELGTGNEEATAKAGKRALKPHAFAKRVRMSKTLARKAPKFVDLLLKKLAYKVGITEERAFLTGDGAEKPLGVFTPSSAGISTARDVVAANNNKIVADDLWQVFFSLKSGYRKKARWIFSRAVLQAIRTLKDANGNYVWSTGMAPGMGMDGVSPTLLGLPYDESEYAPSTPTTTATYQLALCNWEFYWIVDALDLIMQVLDQLYAEKNQNGYILRKETDGAPMQEEAFSRLKLA